MLRWRWPKSGWLFYRAVIQTMLLYGCESWVITEAMYDVLEGLDHRAAHRLTNILPYKQLKAMTGSIHPPRMHLTLLVSTPSDSTSTDNILKWLTTSPPEISGHTARLTLASQAPLTECVGGTKSSGGIWKWRRTTNSSPLSVEKSYNK